jgi:hypothetical protein
VTNKYCILRRSAEDKYFWRRNEHFSAHVSFFNIKQKILHHSNGLHTYKRRTWRHMNKSTSNTFFHGSNIIKQIFYVLIVVLPLFAIQIRKKFGDTVKKLFLSKLVFPDPDSGFMPPPGSESVHFLHGWILARFQILVLFA